MSNKEEHIKSLLRTGETPIDKEVAHDIFANINKGLADSSDNIRKLPATTIWKKPIMRWLAASILLNIGLGTVVFLNYSDDKDMRLMNGLIIEDQPIVDSSRTAPPADTIHGESLNLVSPN